MNCPVCFYRSSNSFWTCEVKRSLDKSLFRISAFSSLRTSLHTTYLHLVLIFFSELHFFSHLFFSHESFVSSLWLCTCPSLPPSFRLPLSPAATSSLPPAALCSLSSWRIVSMHEQACWWDQLSISSHKTIDLIPWHRDACTCTNTPLSAVQHSIVQEALGKSEALCVRHTLNCVCDMFKSCPKMGAV